MRVTPSIVPNLFTLANLFCGFAAIISATGSNLTGAAWFIMAAGVFDMLDGVMARLTNSASDFGVELDSLCDAVSFGVAPAVVLYELYFHNWADWGLLIASIPALAAVLRLARFNTQLTSLEDKAYFRGMPVPAGALTIISYAIFIHPQIQVAGSYQAWSILTVTLITALVMLSTIKYDNLPRPSLRAIRQRPIVFVLFLAAGIAIVITRGNALFPVMALYIMVGAVRHVFNVLQKRSDDNDTMEEPDPDPFQM